MLVKLQSFFSIIVGASLCGIWVMLLSSGSVADLEERPVLITAHLVSEFLTAGFLLFGGISLLRKKPFALRVLLVGFGLLMYSSLNAGAYYADAGAMQYVFIGIFIAALVLTIFTIARPPSKAKNIPAK